MYPENSVIDLTPLHHAAVQYYEELSYPSLGKMMRTLTGDLVYLGPPPHTAAAEVKLHISGYEAGLERSLRQGYVYHLYLTTLFTEDIFDRTHQEEMPNQPPKFSTRLTHKWVPGSLEVYTSDEKMIPYTYQNKTVITKEPPARARYRLHLQVFYQGGHLKWDATALQTSRELRFTEVLEGATGLSEK